MRKTGLKNRSRRKTSSSSNSSNSPSRNNTTPTASSSSESQTGSATAVTNNNNSGSERRKPTSEEAGLTAKNYRLAKELSDLRVRHRDETKNVTRLTMENMNLASRCREAISHVAMLKKELALHQRRNADLTAMQKQGTKSHLSPDLSANINMETSPEDELDGIVEQASISMPSIRKDPTLAQDQEQAMEQHRALELSPASTQKADRRKIQSIGNNRRDTRSKINLTHHSSPSRSRQKKDDFEPSPASIPTKTENQSHKSVPPTDTLANNEPQPESTNLNPDDAFGELQTSDFFQQQSYKLPLESTPERDDVEDNRGSSDIDKFKPFSTIKTFDDELVDKGQRNPGLGSSGMDAFDASFSTTFPTSFPMPTTKLSPTVDRAFNVPDFSNNFFLSPSETQTSNTRDNNKHDFPTAPTTQPTNEDNDQATNKPQAHNAPRITGFGKPNVKKANKVLFPSNAFSTFENFSTNEPTQLKTPKQKVVNSDDTNHKSKISERKTISNDKMKDSQTKINRPKSDNRAVEEHSPTLVLRRLHQRRAKERANNSGTGSKLETEGNSSSDIKDGKEEGNGMKRDEELSSRRDLNSRFAMSRPTSGRGKVANGNMKTLSAEYMSDEFRHLDAIANGSSPARVTSSMSTRRNAKQPISYAEPSISTKLRRGDVFFQRKDSTNPEEKENPEGKEPIDTDYNMYNKGRKSKGVDDVLKDLVSTTVP